MEIKINIVNRNLIFPEEGENKNVVIYLPGVRGVLEPKDDRHSRGLGMVGIRSVLRR